MRGERREERGGERLRGDLTHITGEAERKERATESRTRRRGSDGADWLFAALTQSATVRPGSQPEPPPWDGDRLGSPRCIDPQARSFGRIGMDGACLRPRFIYLFIWCLLRPRPHLSGNMGLPTGAQQLQMSRLDN